MTSPPPLTWILTSPKSFKVSFLQGLYESASEIDLETKTVIVCVLPVHASMVFSLLCELDANPTWASTDPPIIEISVEDAAKIPVFNEMIHSDKFTLLRDLVK